LNNGDAMPAVLVVDADAPTLDLLREWLADAGWRVVDEPAAAPVALVLVDVPFPRRGLSPPSLRAAQVHAGVPVLALSASFHPSVEGSGEAARSLGVAGVLPKPLRREALLAAVGQLSRARQP
jgi:CheY-like chemotaxis protein